MKSVLGKARDLLVKNGWRPVRPDPAKTPPGALSLMDALNAAARAHANQDEAALLLEDACSQLARTIKWEHDIFSKRGSDFNVIEHFCALPSTSLGRVLTLFR